MIVAKGWNDEVIIDATPEQAAEAKGFAVINEGSFIPDWAKSAIIAHREEQKQIAIINQAILEDSIISSESPTLDDVNELNILRNAGLKISELAKRWNPTHIRNMILEAK